MPIQETLIERSTSVSFGITLASIAIFTIYYVVTSALAWRRLREFPGPFSASFSYFWLIGLLKSARVSELTISAAKRYGKTVRVGPNDLVTSDPEVVLRLSAARSRYTRSDWYRAVRMDGYDDNMMSLLDTTQHDKLKAKVMPGYTGKDHTGLEAELDFMINTLIDKIRTKYAATPAQEGGGERRPLLDLATLIQYFALDSITKVAFGEELGFLRTESDVFGYVKMATEFLPALTITSTVPWLNAITTSRWVLWLLAPREGDKTGIGRVLPIAKRIVTTRFAAGPTAKNDDILGSFIRHGLTPTECRTEAIFQLIAGSDTTATSIRSTMLHIITSPHIYRCLQTEIDYAIRAGKVSSPISNAEALALPYLQAVVFEGLRMCPPFTGFPFKCVPPGGDTIDGKFVPAGTRVAPGFPALTRNRDVFGEDADDFRPERFLEAGDEKAAEMRKVVDLVFGSGRWGCVGKNMAFLELNKVYVELLRYFDFQIHDPARPWLSYSHNLYIQSDMWVRVKLRKGVI
ncbi:cytochrome P450 [Lasiosphaeris hirsuta]|uniref:Cytochrome P450 n=1 Tax=Lasiosphaeris hirsuta TaxID=260670 RepID=A0AA40E3P2_9PEZI|nr:cytochrome P450 [Lasiosphaeris hirsuta]